MKILSVSSRRLSPSLNIFGSDCKVVDDNRRRMRRKATQEIAVLLRCLIDEGV
jgi:hypothetical protein